MEQSRSNTISNIRKDSSLEGRVKTRLLDGRAFRSIKREIGSSVNTIRNEYHRGKVLVYNGRKEHYRVAEQGKFERHGCFRRACS